MKFSTKSLTFPSAGVSRARVYREQTRPYTAPWAVNVRAYDPIEDRLRGGSRPGLVKVNPTKFGDDITAVTAVSHIDTSGVRHRDLVVIADGTFSTMRGTTVSVPDVSLITEEGITILDDEGRELLFNSSVGIASPGNFSRTFSTAERYGELLIADATLHVFRPDLGTVEELAATTGIVPTGQPIVAIYRDRVILGGKDQIWYASRQGFPGDWNFGADMNDLGRAVASSAAYSGTIGDQITAIIPFNDTTLLLATKNSLWALHGDPADGKLVRYSSEIGIISHHAWARATEGTRIFFLSHDGLYQVTPGERPMRFSAERNPDELQNIDPSTCSISMAYDANERGYHLFVTPHPDEHGTTPQGSHWWVDLGNDAVWPVIVPPEMQPVAVARQEGITTLSEPVFGCRDGYLRKFSRDAATDDSIPIACHVIVGPFRCTTDDISDAMLTEVHGMMGGGSDTVICHVVMGNSAQECCDKAVTGIKAAMAGEAVAGVAYTCTFHELRNKVFRPRARGIWGIIWLASAGKWAFETVAVKIAQLGRIR